jgi:uncharacterized membrane protein HdeD (DUF308 family)
MRRHGAYAEREHLQDPHRTEEWDMTDASGEFGWPEERSGVERESSRWWAFLALGVLSAVVGLILMLDLSAAVTTLARLVALGLIVTGVGEMVTAGRYDSRLGLVAGALLIVGGVLAVMWPDITLWVLAVVVGIDLVLAGVVRIVGALSLRVEGWGWLLFGGGISVAAGILALAWPGATLLVLGLLLGLRMLLFGISEIMFGLSLHHAHSQM